jgi:hypothetical protein
MVDDNEIRVLIEDDDAPRSSKVDRSIEETNKRAAEFQAEAARHRAKAETARLQIGNALASAKVFLYQSLTRIIEAAPVQNKLPAFGLMAKTAANEAATLRQQYIDDLWSVAGDVVLIRLLGTASVQGALAVAFSGNQP